MVNVIAKDGRKLPPTERHGKVRHLLRDQRAVVACKDPFTIQLLYDHKTKLTDEEAAAKAAEKARQTELMTEAENETEQSK